MGENPTDRQQFWKFCNQETWRRGKLLHQKELVDAFDENKKNEGKQIGTGRGGSDGDNADCWALQNNAESMHYFWRFYRECNTSFQVLEGDNRALARQNNVQARCKFSPRTPASWA